MAETVPALFVGGPHDGQVFDFDPDRTHVVSVDTATELAHIYVRVRVSLLGLSVWVLLDNAMPEPDRLQAIADAVLAPVFWQLAPKPES